MNKVCRISLPIILACMMTGLVMYAANATGRVLASSNDDPNLFAGKPVSQQVAEIQANLLVNTLEDELNNDGDCSLREAIDAANTNLPVDACGAGEVLTDTITFDVAGTITVTSQLVVMDNGPLVVDGADVITTSGGGTTRVWWVDQGSNLNLRNLDVVNGRSGSFDDGAGLYNNRGFLIIDHCLFRDNTFGGSSNYGGGILNWFGDLTVWDSEFTGNGGNYSETYGGGIATWGGTAQILRTTFRQNQAQGLQNGQYEGYAGGGLSVFQSKVSIQDSSFIRNQGYYWGGGIAQQGQSILNISGTSFISNTTSTGGGGIYFGPSNFTVTGTMTVTNSTFSGNEAFYGAGIDLEQGTGLVNNSTISGNIADYGGGLSATTGILSIHNTIIAYNLPGEDCYGPVIDLGHNLDSDGTCNLDPANGSLPNTNPLLGPLQDNGGPTLTQVLLPGSPAIDAGEDTQCQPTDQRGVPRPQDGNGDGIAICDMGAYELELNQLIVTTLEDELNNDGDCSLREAIQAANTNAPVDACGSGEVLIDTITFDVAGIITVTSQLVVMDNGPLVVDGADASTTSGGGTTRVWQVEAGSQLTLAHIAVVDGFVLFSNGAGLVNKNGMVTISDCSFSDNHTNDYGGAISNEGEMMIFNSTFDGNDATGVGGGVGGGIDNSSIMSITDCTFSDNSADYSGGGISSTGLLTITESTFSNNQAFIVGGGITSIGSMTITNSVFTDNTSLNFGAILVSGNLYITNSIINNNHADDSIGGIGNVGVITITNSTFSGNSSINSVGAIANIGTAIITMSTISENTADSYGGLYNDGNLKVDNTNFTENSADICGAIYNTGSMTLTLSTISDNIAAISGGGICNNASLAINNSTLSGNTASAGGGISNWASLSIDNSTFYGNSASEGGTISGTAILTNTIIAGTPLGSDCVGNIIDGGHNLDSDGTCNLDPANGSLPNTDPILGPLQDNGGPTKTHALLPGSPAIDAGDDAQCPPTDQRGVHRPQDGDGDGIALCDIGAYEREFQPVSPMLVEISGPQEGFIDQEYTFTAMVEPVSTTLPITYTWQASDQLPITYTSGISDTVSFTWDGIGTQTITVTASNLFGSVMNTHSIILNDVFISGLSTWNDSPTRLGETTIFSATIQEGTNVVYTWDFGDGGSGSGQVVTHTYKTPGIFTAVVTATNSTNTLTATTEVTVIVPVHSIFIAMAIKSGGSVVGIEISSSGDGSMGITLMARLQTFGKPVFQEQRLNQLGLSSDRWSRYY